MSELCVQGKELSGASKVFALGQYDFLFVPRQQSTESINLISTWHVPPCVGIIFLKINCTERGSFVWSDMKELEQ